MKRIRTRIQQPLPKLSNVLSASGLSLTKSAPRYVKIDIEVSRDINVKETVGI